MKGEYAYRFLMKAINGDPCVIPPGETEEVPLRGMVWFFAASIAPDLETFRKHAQDQADQKGPDFLRRFGQNGYVVELPGIGSPQERALRLASLLRTPITQVDARALYFVAKRDWRDAGELKARVEEAIRKCDGRSILRLEDVANISEIEGLVRSEDTGLARLKDHLLKIRSS